MKHSILRKTPPILVFLLFVSVTSAFACSCLPASTTEAFETSAAVFSGKVTGFEYRKGIPNKYMEQMAKEKGGAFEYEGIRD